MRLHYKLYFFGDLHIGSGIGLPGVIDEYVVRDQDDFPLVPGSAIKGIIRDNCVRLLDYLGMLDSVICQGQKSWVKMPKLMKDLDTEQLCGFKGNETCILCGLFGSPAIQGGWWFSPATYSENYRKVLKDDKLRDNFRLAYRDMAINAQASIDPETKRAKEDHLFSLETVRPYEVWEGDIESQSDPVKSDLLGWLTGAVLFTRRLGGRRRRGWGRCRFDLSDIRYPDNEKALKAMEQVFMRGNNQ